MQVYNLHIQIISLAIYKDGTTKEFLHSYVTGCVPACNYLKKTFDIDTVPSTVWNGKKIHQPLKYPYGNGKNYYLAYLNWVLNYPKEHRAKYFDQEPDVLVYYKNNPIIDVKIIARKSKN